MCKAQNTKYPCTQLAGGVAKYLATLIQFHCSSAYLATILSLDVKVVDESLFIIALLKMSKDKRKFVSVFRRILITWPRRYCFFLFLFFALYFYMNSYNLIRKIFPVVWSASHVNYRLAFIDTYYVDPKPRRPRPPVPPVVLSVLFLVPPLMELLGSVTYSPADAGVVGGLLQPLWGRVKNLEKF